MALVCPSPSQFRQYWRDGPAMAGGRAERLVRPPYMDEEMKPVEGAGEGGTELGPKERTVEGAGESTFLATRRASPEPGSPWSPRASEAGGFDSRLPSDS